VYIQSFFFSLSHTRSSLSHVVSFTYYFFIRAFFHECATIDEKNKTQKIVCMKGQSYGWRYYESFSTIQFPHMDLTHINYNNSHETHHSSHHLLISRDNKKFFFFYFVRGQNFHSFNKFHNIIFLFTFSLPLLSSFSLLNLTSEWKYFQLSLYFHEFETH
jgi:hypothetical protein